MISRKINSAFPPAVRERGEVYFATNRARIVGANDESLTAMVRGTRDYSVALLARRGHLLANCTCPYAADHGVCKHIWAVLRTADREYKLDPLLSRAGPGVTLEGITPEETAADDDFDDTLDDSEYTDEFFDEVLADEPTELRARPQRVPRRNNDWRAFLDIARQNMAMEPPVPPRRPWPANRRVAYVIDLTAPRVAEGVVVEIAVEQQTAEGSWNAPVPYRVGHGDWTLTADPADRHIAQMLIGSLPASPYVAQTNPARFVLREHAIETAIPLMCATGRCRVRVVPNAEPTEPVRWDDGGAWTLRLRMTKERDDCEIAFLLRRNSDEIPLRTVAILHRDGLALTGTTLARVDTCDAFPFVMAFFHAQAPRVPESDVPALLEALYALPARPQIDLPAGTNVLEVRESPLACVVLHRAERMWTAPQHHVEPVFLYGSLRVRASDPSPSVFDREALAVRYRDHEHELQSLNRLVELGAREQWDYAENRRRLTIGAKKLTRFVETLVTSGWRVEADGAVYRGAGEVRAKVRSRVDWFELDAGVTFGDVDASLSDILAAIRKRESTVLLADGSRGLIPADWLARVGPLLSGGTVENGVLRYSRTQAALLDAMLATLPDADVDATFERARAELRAFREVAPADPARTFRGALRDYQREGLGWLHFLRKFGLGGCLADDMGLGKTVQVLALLDARRTLPSRSRRPSIVVVPRSLVFNWFHEAQHFTPRLRLLDYTGISRDPSAITGGETDVVVTTYGTLRRDAAALAAVEFDYAILDEAQAIKTANSASAKAARLLRAQHRLAMTGTPIENRLEELWSLFEFLNPGMLGSSSAFAALARLGPAGDGGASSDRSVLARALRPVILRRTKDQVARELPARVEQTLEVELEGAQRKFYDDLREAYRRSVLDRVSRVGMARAKMHILEALLRLRQAACHPVLADPRKNSAPSAKIDALMPALDEVIAEGHKVLVFSQFTSFLALVRARLDALGLQYEYLDGKTINRQACVERFQGDPACSLFLISLKAGGHGLNLTAADYVFILDPWWNPAVEAQAIDRAHRIGQTRRVIATRIVARNTIEEKILELQASKRALADAILGQDHGVLSGIGRAELEMLLG